MNPKDWVFRPKCMYGTCEMPSDVAEPKTLWDGREGPLGGVVFLCARHASPERCAEDDQEKIAEYVFRPPAEKV